MTTQQKNTYYFMDTQTQRAQSTADKCTKAQTHAHIHIQKQKQSHSSRPIFSALLALLHALAIAAAHFLGRRRRRGRGHSAVVGVIRHHELAAHVVAASAVRGARAFVVRFVGRSPR